jgi:hypothetical protein
MQMIQRTEKTVTVRLSMLNLLCIYGIYTTYSDKSYSLIHLNSKYDSHLTSTLSYKRNMFSSTAVQLKIIWGNVSVRQL